MARRSLSPARLVAAVGLLVAGILSTASPAMAVAPDNDMFADARLLTGPSLFNESELTQGATAEAGEPDHGGRRAAATIWYRWTAPADVVVTSWSALTLFGSSKRPAHALAFYTGDSLDTLEVVVAASGTDPGVTFGATAGTEYKIALNVPSRHAEDGNTHLYLYSTPRNDNLATASPIGGTSGTAAGSVGMATLEEGEPQHSLFEAFGGSVWYDWTAPTTGFTRFGVECCAGNQPVVAVYTGSAMSDLEAVSSGFNCLVGSFNTCTSFHHIRGTTYRIAVQGDGAEFPLRWEPASSGCTVRGTAAADVLVGSAGTDYICGLGGNDVLIGLDGDDVVVGGPGLDTVDFSRAGSVVEADLSRAAAIGEGTDTLQLVENVTGSRFDDDLRGDRVANRLRGGGGADLLWGQAGDDRLFGGAGDDFVAPGSGKDHADAGDGADLAYYGMSTARVEVNLRAGTATGEGADVLVGFEDVAGSPQRDHLIGGRGPNLLFGDSGHDVLEGRGGADGLRGQDGDDFLNGGRGADDCRGGRGEDTRTRCES